MLSPSVVDCAVSKRQVQFYVCREAIITFPMFDRQVIFFDVLDASDAGLLNLAT